MKLQLQTELDIDKIMPDVLATAFEGGIGYWCQILGYRPPDVDDHMDLSDEPWRKDTNWPLAPGGGVGLMDIEDDAGIWFLDREAIELGLETMSRCPWPVTAQRLKRIIDENYDADDADVLIQTALFGETVYG